MMPASATNDKTRSFNFVEYYRNLYLEINQRESMVVREQALNSDGWGLNLSLIHLLAV